MRNARIVGALMALGFARAAAALSIDDIMHHNYYATKVAVLTSESTMLLTNASGSTRERKLTGIARLQPDGVDADVVIEFNAPPDVRGTRFLQIQHSERDDDMWIYLPALHKSRRLVASNKRDSFIGTDFSYGDILPLDPANFRNRLLREETLDGSDCFVVESSAKDVAYERDLGYRRRLLWIRKDNFIEVKVDYYDGDGRIVKTQTTADHVLVQPELNRWVVRQREMIDRDTGHRTLIKIDKLDQHSAIPDRLFRVEALGAR